MDPLSITAAVLGIAAPTVQSIQHLRHNIQAISDAPDDIASLGEDLLTIEQAITSIQEVSEPQWLTLGESVIAQYKTGINLCRKSCTRFQAAIEHWTRHGEAVKLSWRDRTAIGLFKQDQIKYTSSQLQNCKLTLPSVIGIANFHSSLQQTSAGEEMMKLVWKKEAEISKAVSATEKQLHEVQSMLKSLHLASLEDLEENPDQVNAQRQIETEKFALEQSIDLLKALNEDVSSAAKDLRKGQGQALSTVRFGEHNFGVQTGISNAPINFSLGK
ncbi:hypothetical protein NW762_014749 [Fusarium torreyae]|uniref:Azaphilone pigments biosynthesis cluster protein L N-terminal domain-containing protein n=1 Tax=Fusarium torreyae TaxID=1237075 RepID=A0A9W8RKW3_9HYPO|nr:hypothetical protein NW762_014749 [Fusarium torreyae]